MCVLPGVFSDLTRAYLGGTTGTLPGKTYAKSIETMPMTTIRNTLCLMVNRKSLLSSARVMPVAATATAMLWTEIILPITPAAEFTEAVNTGLRFRAVAVTTCRLPNSAFADVSLPVRKTPSHPSVALKNGNAPPLVASASPSVEVIPE